MTIEKLPPGKLERRITESMDRIRKSLYMPSSESSRALIPKLTPKGLTPKEKRYIHMQGSKPAIDCRSLTLERLDKELRESNIEDSLLVIGTYHFLFKDMAPVYELIEKYNLPISMVEEYLAGK